MRVVPSLDEVEDGHSGLGLVLEAVLFEELALEGGEEALGERVVVGVPDGADGGTRPGMLASEGSVLTPLVRVQDDPAGAPLLHRHVQGLEDQLRLQVRLHGPAHHPPAPGVDDDGEVEEAGGGRHVGDVCHPESVRALGAEVSLDQVRCWASLAIPLRGAPLPSARHPDDPRLPHKAPYALVVDQKALVPELGVDPRTYIAPAAEGMDSSHPPDESVVGHVPRGRGSLEPGIEAAGGEAQHTTHRPNRKLGLVPPHELEPRPGIELLSRANQAAAFLRISRRTLSCLLSRRRRRSSSRSSDVRPSDREPSSRPACFSQFRIVCAVGSNSSASSSGDRPAFTSSIIGARNSGSYGALAFPMMGSFLRRDAVSTVRVQLQTIACRVSMRLLCGIGASIVRTHNVLASPGVEVWIDINNRAGWRGVPPPSYAISHCG